MDNTDLEENIKAKEIELSKLFGFSTFEQPPPLSFIPTANFNFESNVPQWPSNVYNENYVQPIPVQNLSLELSQLHIDIPNYAILPQRMLPASPFDPRDLVQGDIPSNYDCGPQFREPSTSYHTQYERERRFHPKDRQQYHHKKKHNRNPRRKFVIDEQELANVVIDLNELKLGPEYEQTTEEDILNDFWRLYTYLDEISKERQNILKALECSNSVCGETCVPKRVLTVRQSHEYATNCISMELDMVYNVLKAIKFYYDSELEALVENTEFSLMEIKSSMKNFHLAACSAIQDCNPNQRARDLNSKFDYLQSALSNVTLHVRKLGTNIFMLAHYVTVLSENNEGASSRSTFHGS